MSYELRPYQEEGVSESIKYLNGGGKKLGIVIAPTGAGKSFYIAELARRLKEPVLVLQPSKELLEQNYQKYTMYGHDASIYSASLKSREIGKEVTFGTIGTVKSDVEGFIMAGIKTVIIDECHLASKNSSQLSQFLESLGIQKVVGLTATPLELKSSREHGSYLQFLTRSKSNIFKDVIHITQIKDVIDMGFWADIVYEELSVDTSRLKLNTSSTDFTASSLVEHYFHNNLESKIIHTVEELLRKGRKSILIFCPSIEYGDSLSAKLNISGLNSESVHSKLKKVDRDRIIDNFRSLKLPVVTNVNVLSVGFDHPQLDAVIMARPTNSFSIYYQQVGRGVRPHEKKKNFIICDFSDNIKRFGRLEGVVFTQDNGKYEMYSGEKKLTNILYTQKSTEQWDYDRNTTLWFGRFIGQNISEVYSKYLEWMILNFDFSDYPVLKANIERELRYRHAEGLLE